MALTTNKYRNKKIKNAHGTFDSIKKHEIRTTRVILNARK